MTSEEQDQEPTLEERTNDLVSDIIESGELGTPIGIVVGWTIVIAEWDMQTNQGWTSIRSKRGQPRMMTSGMLREAQIHVDNAADYPPDLEFSGEDDEDGAST